MDRLPLGSGPHSRRRRGPGGSAHPEGGSRRGRYLLMERMREEWEGVDVVVAPTRAPNLSTVTNLTGHPAIAVPNGFRENGTPVTISFLGQLFGEEKMLTLAHAYQQATGFHLEQPSAFATPSSAPWNG